LELYKKKNKLKIKNLKKRLLIIIIGLNINFLHLVYFIY